jgi:hypothetical protein
VTQGIFDDVGQRFKTKKALVEAVKDGQEVCLEATSMFGNEYHGILQKAPNGDYFVVGPSPYERKWYAQIKVRVGKVIVK